MLRKLPAARPTITRCRDVLAEDHLETKALSPARQALTDAAAIVEQRTARQNAERAQRDEERKRRVELASTAIVELKAITRRVEDEIKHIYDRAKPGFKGMLEFGAARFGLVRAPEAVDEFLVAAL